MLAIKTLAEFQQMRRQRIEIKHDQSHNTAMKVNAWQFAIVPANGEPTES
jgi:hypothetical protein